VWIGRRWQSVRGWFGRRTLWQKLLLGAALFTSPCWCCTGGALTRNTYNYWFTYTAEDRAFIKNDRNGYEGGLPSVARRLKAEMEPIPDPEIAVQLHPDWAAVRFPNGEWVFGHGVNSHGFSVGHGTLVLKDSRGRVRIFFGHVCGPNAGMDWGRTDLYKSLDQFDKDYLLWLGMLREWVPPP
jgi:hypothetical protein